MDISLLSIKIKSDKSKKIYWSGANNSLFYVQDEEIIKINSDKQPIGKHDNRKPFITHTIPQQTENKKPQTFYLFSDGYADQFGGPHGKKLMSKTFKELLLVNSNLPMPNQKKILDETIEKWKGGREQVDDILVIGIRV